MAFFFVSCSLAPALARSLVPRKQLAFIWRAVNQEIERSVGSLSSLVCYAIGKCLVSSTRNPDRLASQGFQLFWKWKSSGRPRLAESIRKLIVQMARENRLGDSGVGSGAVVKLVSCFSAYSARLCPEPERRGTEDSSQNWRTFVASRQSIVACDFLSW